MAASEAISGYDAAFHVEDSAGSGTYVELSEVTDISPPNEQADKIEVTHMKSPLKRKEFIAGMIDGGDMDVTMNHIPNSATHQFLIAWRANSENRACRVVWPDGSYDQYPGFPDGFAVNTVKTNDAITAKLTVKVAGAVIFTPAA